MSLLSTSPNRWLSLIGICAVTALVWVTASDISLALPTIAREFGGSMDTLQWAVNGYFLAGSLIIVGGKLGDIFGRRFVFAMGTLLILVGSVVAGLAQDPTMLIVGRIIEGVGAAAILPSALAIVAVSFSGRERDTAIGAWIATCWGAQAVGPLVGGLLIATLSWQWIFWINLPIGAVALLLMWKTTPESSEEGADRRIDIGGALTLVGGIGLISYGLVQADTASPRELAGYCLVALLLLVAFVLIERRVRNPVVQLSIFRRGRFNGAVLANLIANVIFGATIFFMALYLQVVEDMSPLRAGVMLLPATIPILLANPFGTRLGLRFGPWLPTAVGMVLLAAASVLLLELTGSYNQLIVPFLLLGAGIGLQITPCAAVAVEDPDGAGEGVASGVYKASSMIGGSLGVALGTAIFQTRARLELERMLQPFDPTYKQLGEYLDVLTGSAKADDIIPAAGMDVTATVTRAFDVAVAYAMVPSVISAVIGVGVAVLLLRGKAPAPDEM
jgi:EmrB/QacA subfamily drug resistance transporter